MNLPPELPGGLLARTIAETVGSLLLDASPLRLQYQAMGGSAEDRAAGQHTASRLRRALPPLRLFGLPCACPADRHPPCRAGQADAASIAAACAADPLIRAIYLVPTNDNPTAETLDEDARRAIAATAIRYHLQVIEDDAYGPLAVAPLAPVAVHAPDHSWHIASASKIISPALRVAFVRAPNVAAAVQLAMQIHQTAVMPPPLNAAMLSRWIDDGTATRLIAAMRDEASGGRRSQQACSTGWTSRPPAGLSSMAAPARCDRAQRSGRCDAPDRSLGDAGRPLLGGRCPGQCDPRLARRPRRRRSAHPGPGILRGHAGAAI
ncbi:putative HTH-type transcriptional regulator [Ditylenchus destructor]|uniref:HTH-type transcriptional regulator n=1 Tax=Ditylenchus destructor TaxID=166010 RepID=A0AAD4QUZ9_9BILA|nr:putative HTH-type transcriptional regulator [Ditylenchus destructor]